MRTSDKLGLELISMASPGPGALYAIVLLSSTTDAPYLYRTAAVPTVLPLTVLL